MAAIDLLVKLKLRLETEQPLLVEIFTDDELLGMIDESREWCAQGYTTRRTVTLNTQ